MDKASYLNMANDTDYGIALSTTEPERLRQAFYKEINKLRLKGLYSLVVNGDELWIIRKENLNDI